MDDLTVSDGIPMSDGLTHRVLSTANIQLTSAFNGAKYFYFEYPDGSTVDTVYMDMQRSPATGCQYVMDGLLINRFWPTTDSLNVAAGTDSLYIVNHR